LTGRNAGIRLPTTIGHPRCKRKDSSMDTTTSTTTSAEQGSREALAQSLRHMVSEAEQLLKSASSAGGEQFKAARERFETQLDRAKIELKDLEEAALYNAKRAARATDEAVHEHPYVAIGIAAGVGALIGMLIARR
jgi:ElaB/YqjD/DUF883 family membrane-anchored ribosome-binding protein